MSKHDLAKTQTHVLSLNIGCKCNGCERKVKKLIQKINGVYATSIDMEQGKVTVTGNVDPDVLIMKLNKSGKHAEIWGGNQKGLTVFNNKNAGQFDVPGGIDKMPGPKGEKDLQKDSGGPGGGSQQKQVAIQQLIQEMKLKPPVKVKDDGGDIDGGGGGGGVRVMVKGEEGGGEKAKKAGGGKRVMSMIGKAIGGKIEGKDGNLGKKGGGGEGKIGNKGGGGGYPGLEVTNGHNASKLPAAHGQDAAPMVSVNGGPDPVAGPYQQPQYMTTVNQQGMMNGGGGGGDMHHPPIYGRPGYGYVPPMPPPVYHDPATNMFSDENPESCSIM